MLNYCFKNINKLAITGAALVCITIVASITCIESGNMAINQNRDIMVTLEMPSGSSLEATSEKAGILEKQFKNVTHVKNVSVKIEPSSADFIIKTEDDAEKGSIVARLKQEAASIHDASVIFRDDAPSGYTNSVELEVTGPDIDTIRRITRKLASSIHALQGIEDVILHFKEKRPELHIMVDRPKSASTGISAAQTGSFIRNALFGPVATKYIDSHEVDVRATLDLGNRNDISQLPFIKLPTADNKWVPLGAVTRIKKTTSINSIWRKNRQRMQALTVYHHDLDLETLVHRIEKEIERIQIPEEYHISFGKSIEKYRSSQKSIRISIALAILLVYMVTASVFESLTLPFLVILSIPLSAVIVAWTMIVTGISLTFSTGMGLVVLIGIVVNNAIVLIDTYEVNLAGKDITIKSIIELSRSRLRPVIMTTLTTTLGMLPLLFSSQGSSLWQGFALTIITGLAGATVLVLFVIPVGYYYLKRSTQRPREKEENAEGFSLY